MLRKGFTISLSTFSSVSACRLLPNICNCVSILIVDGLLSRFLRNVWNSYRSVHVSRFDGGLDLSIMILCHLRFPDSGLQVCCDHPQSCEQACFDSLAFLVFLAGLKGSLLSIRLWVTVVSYIQVLLK